MDAFLEAIMSKDLVKAEKAFSAIMAEKTQALIEKEKVAIAASVVVEGEDEEDEEDEDKDDKKDSKPKDKSDKEDEDDGDDEDDEDDEDKEDE
ncbi:prohead [Serratia phage 92A1]|nr:prohead [Serratia phage 92A1]